MTEERWLFKEVAQEPKLAGGGGYHVVLLDRADIDEFVSSNVGFLPGLEGSSLIPIGGLVGAA